VRIGSLFAGIGGFDLAAEWVGWETAWFSEIDPYASAVLKKHWPNVPNLGDITQIRNAPKVDLLCGGFPCQDISNAGKQAGIGGERSGLWKEYVRLIEEIRPRWVVAENVAVLRSRGLNTVLSDLASIGYDVEWHCIPASAVGAPHQRDRIWIIAYPNTHQPGPQGRLCPELSERAGERIAGTLDSSMANAGSGRCGGQGSREDQQPGGAEAVGTGQAMAHAPRQLLDGARLARASRWVEFADGGEDVPNADNQVEPDVSIDDVAWRSLPKSAGRLGWWQSEPNVGRVANGVPSRVDRLRCCGNAIVPQVAEIIFEAIALEDMMEAAA
jgi:DNA (cytosine-5)-methyltransferase 1